VENGGSLVVKLLIVDDQELMRDGLATILNLKSEIEVVGVASNGQEAFEKAGDLLPDIVLMDIRMPVANGVEGTKLITSTYPDIKVLMLTTFNDSALIFEALEEGASGYLLKDMPTEAIVQAIMTVQSGGMVLPKELTADIVREMRKNQTVDHTSTVPEIIKELTEREIEVLNKLGLGFNNKEIASQLFISEGTVKNHVSNLISKLNLRDRTQAAIFAVRYNITTF
jgi:DNA-binding NarL/FixJ family response regulator